jgi:phosphoenolpyruvate carboxykinase (ATP)
MTLPPNRYSSLLGEKLRKHQAEAWLLNTGWIGGGFGHGRRIELAHTRALVSAVLNGALKGVPTTVDPIFGLAYPNSCFGVPREILNPRDLWPNPSAYDAQARRLSGLFRENFERFRDVEARIVAAGPRG